MKPAPFTYEKPRSIDEACAILAEAGGGATIIAGGQTLMPLLALRMSQPFILVDITAVPELHGVTKVEGAVRIGPATRQNDAIADAILQRELPVLVQALRHVGHHQTRNRGTVGGSIAFAEPAAEMPATAVALGASLRVRSVRGDRTIAAEDLYVGPYATQLESDELVTAIDYPDWPAGAVPLFREVARRPGDFALTGLVGALVEAGGRVTRAGLAWFGMGATPIRARQAERALLDGERDAAALAALAVADTDPFDDQHASAEYRRTVGRRIFAQTLAQALDTRQAA